MRAALGKIGGWLSRNSDGVGTALGIADRAATTLTLAQVGLSLGAITLGVASAPALLGALGVGLGLRFGVKAAVKGAKWAMKRFGKGWGGRQRRTAGTKSTRSTGREGRRAGRNEAFREAGRRIGGIGQEFLGAALGATAKGLRVGRIAPKGGMTRTRAADRALRGGVLGANRRVGGPTAEAMRKAHHERGTRGRDQHQRTDAGQRRRRQSRRRTAGRGA